MGAAPTRFRTFRRRLVAAMMILVGGLTSAGLYFAQRHAEDEAEQEVERDFHAALDGLRAVRDTRIQALQQRCLTLVQKVRIHAALEDDALDLLYPNARDELSDLMAPPEVGPRKANALPATFWRFLDVHGAVIPVANSPAFGALTAAETAQLALPRVPASPQLGYLLRTGHDAAAGTFDQIITTPIFSTATKKPIAALTVGFASTVERAIGGESAVRRGIWAENRLQLPGLEPEAHQALGQELRRLLRVDSGTGKATPITLGAAAYLLLFEPINPGSAYPIAHEVSLYPLAATHERQRRLRWQILGLGSLLLLAGLATSQVVAARFSRPIEKLAADSAQNIVRRDRAEAALELTQAELQRAARFSADASHQLKTPIAVLRAGLDELMARTDISDVVREELSTLMNQTYRITGMIEDLLLLSRVDEGRLKIEFTAVDLTHLVASWLDDLSVLPNALDITITTDLPTQVTIAGERPYVSMILQNLFENARKYNRPGGRIHIAARVSDSLVRLNIGNTGRTIPISSQPHIFNRFHRGAATEDVPGHGLGLNLARELARLHGGDVRLLSSADDWTEFEVIFRLATPTQGFMRSST